MDNDPTQPGISLGRRGHAVFLRPVTDGDMPFLFYIATVGENLVRWRLRGRTVKPANFQQFVWTTTDIQFLICRTDSEQPVGHVCTYQTDEFSGTTKVAAVLAPSFHRLGWPMKGCISS